ncbi:MAG: AAA family ATPase [Isosphaeraceae bacterium]
MSTKKSKTSHPNGTDGSDRGHLIKGSYFLSLELENVRCFSERQKLDLSDGNGRPARWTILLGENGTGKTTILQLLLAVRADLQSPRNNPPDSILDPSSTFWPMILAGRYSFSLFRGSQPNPKIDTLYYNISGKKQYIITIQKSENRSNTVECFGNVSNVTGDGVLIFPECFAYGAGRIASTSSFEPSERSGAFESLFTDDAKLRNAEEWLLLLDYSASKSSGVQDRQKQHLEMVEDVLIQVLPDVSEIRFDASSGVWPTPAVEFKTHYGWVSLRQLGYGYRTTIAWIVDFVSRMIERYPDSPNPLAEPAVVLVDEIDLHLHPKWQRELIGFLTERFPNTQFIVTAHSPLIVQAASDANIALLKREGDHVVIENHPETIRGWRIDQVLTSDLFGLETARPPDVEKLLLRRKKLITKSRMTAADRKELKSLESQLGPIPPGETFEQAKTMQLIQESLDLLKKHQGTKP